MRNTKSPVKCSGCHFQNCYQAILYHKERIFLRVFLEDAFPQTPIRFAIRATQYKFIGSHGIWDIDQLYDINADPVEVNNLIRNPAHQTIAAGLNKKLWQWLQDTKGLYIPLKPITDTKRDHLYENMW
ncbi:MAG: sulfatase/phosphatase domain-containing protein [Niabella sp.]